MNRLETSCCVTVIHAENKHTKGHKLHTDVVCTHIDTHMWTLLAGILQVFNECVVDQENYGLIYSSHVCDGTQQAVIELEVTSRCTYKSTRGVFVCERQKQRSVLFTIFVLEHL